MKNNIGKTDVSCWGNLRALFFIRNAKLKTDADILELITDEAWKRTAWNSACFFFYLFLYFLVLQCLSLCVLFTNIPGPSPFTVLLRARDVIMMCLRRMWLYSFSLSLWDISPNQINICKTSSHKFPKIPKNLSTITCSHSKCFHHLSQNPGTVLMCFHVYSFDTVKLLVAAATQVQFGSYLNEWMNEETFKLTYVKKIKKNTNTSGFCSIYSNIKI